MASFRLRPTRASGAPKFQGWAVTLNTPTWSDLFQRLYSQPRSNAQFEDSNMSQHGDDIIAPIYLQGYVPRAPQWVPETAESTKSSIYYVLSYMYVPGIKFNL